MKNDPKNITQSPEAPQYTLGATTSDAKEANEIAKSNVPDPGGIVSRLGQQWQIPRAGTDASISRDGHGLPNG